MNLFLTQQQIEALPGWMQLTLFAAWIAFMLSASSLLVRVMRGR